MVFWNESTSQLGEYLGACPSGFGIAANYTFLLIALLAKVKKSEQAVATGMIYLFRSLGQVVGVALSGALLQSLLTGQLRERLRGVDEKVSFDLRKRIRGGSSSLSPDPVCREGLEVR